MPKSKILNILIANNIKIESFHLYYDEKESVDKFTIKITNRIKSEYFDFYMGVLRRSRHSSLNYNLYCKIDKIRYSCDLAVKFDLIKLNKPCINDILQSLIIDYDSGSYSFHEFCKEFDYNFSTRESLDVYLKCQNNRDKIKNLFSDNLIELLRQEF